MKPQDYMTPVEHYQYLMGIQDAQKKSYEMGAWMRRTSLSGTEIGEIHSFTGYTKYGIRGVLTHLRHLKEQI